MRTTEYIMRIISCLNTSAAAEAIIALRNGKQLPLSESDKTHPHFQWEQARLQELTQGKGTLAPALLEEAVGITALASRELSQATTHFERSLDFRGRHLAKEFLKLGVVSHNTGNLAETLKNYVQAIAKLNAFKENRESIEKALGKGPKK